MNYIYKILVCLMVPLLFMACEKEWEGELYQKTVSFGTPGLIQIHVKYDVESGYAPYSIPVLITGTSNNEEDIEVTLAIDNDTLEQLNFERFRLRDDLYYIQLAEENYEFEKMTTVIPQGENTALVDVNFIIKDLNFIDNYVLPLEVIATSKYHPTTRKYYSKSMIEVIPFNDYSGIYSASAGLVWDRTRSESSQTALTVPTRETRVVDENTVFFFAGVTEEEAQNRGKYKIKAEFEVIGNDSIVTLTADSASINFAQQKGTFSVKTENDALLPYLERSYTTLDLEYIFDDVTNPVHPLKYRFKGTMTLERKINTLIPEEDQQVIF
ncbi:MAG: DUF4973 domain-containing protein [Bacteroidales bacterium]|jgi:hypothetical protein|nr:DUF4973 domain-containing protein [Bacteroidales bacterium]